MLSEGIVHCSEGTSPFERVTHLYSPDWHSPHPLEWDYHTRTSGASTPVQVGLMHPFKSGGGKNEFYKLLFFCRRPKFYLSVKLVQASSSKNRTCPILETDIRPTIR